MNDEELLREQIQWIRTEKEKPQEFVSVLICVPCEAPLPIVREAYFANGYFRAIYSEFSVSEVPMWADMPVGHCVDHVAKLGTGGTCHGEN